MAEKLRYNKIIDLLERAAIIGWKGDFHRDDQVETAFDLISTAGAKALGIADYGIEVAGAATLFTIPATCIPEAVAAHPPRRLVLFDSSNRTCRFPASALGQDVISSPTARCTHARSRDRNARRRARVETSRPCVA